MKTNTIIQGLAELQLKKLPDKSINCSVTSPPYWSLRNYQIEGQLGLESTFQEFIIKLCNIFDEVKRVLRNDGTCWVNLGDTYIGNGVSRHKGYSHPKNQKVGKIDYDEPSAMKQTLPTKCLAMIPPRFAIEMCNHGWILRNTIIWHKPNCMPSSCKDRFTVDFEYLFLFSKNKRYYFKQQFEPHKNEIDVKYRVGLRNGKKYNSKQPYKKNVPYSVQPRSKEIVEYRNLPKLNEFSEYLNEARKCKKLTVDKIENIFKSQAPHHWFNGESFPSKEDYLKLKEILNFGDYYDRQMKEIFTKSSEKSTYEEGKNKRAVWSINTKPSSNNHIASYPEKLIETPIRAGCPVGGVILDPFFGSGTTGLVALKQNKKFVGIELNSEYISIAKKRLTPLLEQRKIKW